MTKEELKKEAENWLRKYLLCCNCEKKCNCIDSNSYCEEQVLKAYVDGAEFGYNKANEWHYVEDGDLPKEEKEYLVIFESDGTKYKSLESYYPDTKEWSTICKIIAWKEIVLPKGV